VKTTGKTPIVTTARALIDTVVAICSERYKHEPDEHVRVGYTVCKRRDLNSAAKVALRDVELLQEVFEV
jgi:hypothetical protein